MALPGYGQTPISVTSTADSGPGTLREAITTANGNTALTYLITLPANQTITLTSALPDITFSGTIAGGSTLCPATGVGGSTIARDPTAGEFRLLNLTGSNKTLVVADMIFLNGLVTTTGEQGAAIQVVITANHNLIVQQCVFRNNRAHLVGALRMQGFGNLVIEDSYFDENTSVLSSGVRTLLASNAGSTVRIDRTAFRQSTEGTGYIISFDNVATARISNSTFARGSITSGYVIRVINSQSVPVSLTLEHNTFGLVANSHVYANASNANISVQLRNNVFTTNGTTGFLAINSTGSATFTSLGGNVFASDITSNLTLLASDKNNVGTAGLGLGSLTTVAGECIPVIPLGCFSQAIDAAVSSTLTTDALGTSQIGTARDAGAYESSNAASVTFTVASPAAVCMGSMATLTASGCTGGTVAWPGAITGNTYSTSVAGTYTATCTIGTCTTTASGTVVNSPMSYTVTSLADDGVGTLRRAFADIGASSCTGQFTITFGVSGTVNLASGLTAPANKNVTIVGTSGTTTAITLNGGGASSNFSILSVPGSATLSVRYLAFTNGNISGNGGAISLTGGRLQLEYCHLYGNAASIFGGALYHGGGSFTITNSTFASNTAISNSGALHKAASNPGLIENCTFSGNVARAGGAIEASVGSLTINNSTFTRNLAIGNPTGADGGAIFGGSPNRVTINNCLIVGNSALGTGPDLLGGFTSTTGYNLIGNTTGYTLNGTTTGNIINVSAEQYRLANLGNYGGAAPTHALLPGSIAINAGSPSGVPTTDQRGISRVGTPDIGAFESQGFVLAISSGNNQSAFPTVAFANPLQVSVSSVYGEPVEGGLVSFSAPVSGPSATLSSTTATISSGMAAVNATANATAGGPYSTTASATGTSPATVQFSLTNTACPPAVISVTSTADSGPGTLREAITYVNALTACGPFLITLPANQTIGLTSALPDITFSGSIVGGSTLCPATGVGGSTIARTGSAEFRLLTQPNGSLVIRDLILQNGDAPSSDDVGGAIKTENASLTVIQCLFRQNTGGQGGAIGNNTSTLLVDQSLFDDNSGALSSVVNNNFAGITRLTRSTLRQNNTNTSSLVYIGAGSVEIINCTMASSTFNTFVIRQNGANGASSLLVRHSTIQAPNTDYAIGVTRYTTSQSIQLQNSIFGPVVVSPLLFDGSSGLITASSGGGNMFAGDFTAGNNASGTFTGITTDKNNLGAGLGLGSLTALGGECNLTIPLLPGSAAINAGVSTAFTTDARGISRVGSPDAGSFESRGFTLSLNSGNNQSAPVNTAFANPLRVSVSSATSEPVEGGVVSFSARATGSSAILSSTTATISSGTAAVNATANATQGGPYNVSATSAGSSTTVQFSLTNAAPCVYSYTANLNDTGAGSLRNVLATIGTISGCTGQFTVTFATSGIVSLTSGLSVPANRDILIQGPSSTTTSVTLRGGGTSSNFSILSVPGSAKLTTQYLAFTNGRTSGNGGAISLIGGDLLVANCYFYNNTAGNTGGAVAQNSGSFTITNSTFASNTAISNSGALHKNTNEPCLIENCTFSGNVARAGGAIEAAVGSLTINNSTFTLNRAVGNPSPTGAEGGAIYGGNGSYFVTINNCLIAGNTSLGIGHDLVGGFNSGLGHNLIGNTAGEATLGGTTTGNLTNIPGSDYLLSALGNYDGATPTHALLPGSIAINAGSVSGAITQDQREISRVSRPDIGAFESRGFTVNVSSGNNQTALLGAAFANPLRVIVVGNDVSEPVIGGVVTFHAPATFPSASLSGSNVTITSGFTAQVTALASAGSGAYSVTALTRGGTTSAQFSLTNACQTIVYVTEAGAGLQNGTSWTNAYSGTALQNAIFLAVGCPAGQVWVARGIYKPTTTTDRNASFRMANDVAIYGGFAGYETSLASRTLTSPLTGQPSSSTLSGDIGTVDEPSDNSYHVISNNYTFPLNNLAILDGFVITGGQADQAVNATNSRGGGMFNRGNGFVCNPTIRNCVFVNNWAIYGGAVNNVGTSNPAFTNCVFLNNEAFASGGAIENYGIGSGNNASPTLTNVLFSGNQAADGAAIYNNGSTSGISSPTLVNVSFIGNGRVIYNNANNNGTSSPLLTNVSFYRNTGIVLYNSGGTNGSSRPTLTNCVVFGNVGTTFYNENTTNASVTATYSLFDAAIDPATYTATNSLTTTISPFASTTSTELSSCAPAINAGNNAAPGLSGISTDIAGVNRIFGTTVDMGAYEFTGSIIAQTAFTTQPVAGSSVCTGAMVTASVSVSGTGPFSYQWYRNGTALTGITSATTASLTLSNVTSASAGSYSVVVTGSCNSVTSTAFSLTVNPPPAAGLLNNGPLTCAQTSVTLTASGGVSYTFANAGGTLGTPGASTTRTVSSPGTYSVTVGDSNGCISTTTTTVGSNTVVPSLTLTAGNACAGQPVTLTATGGLSSYTFTGPGGLISSGALRTAPVSGLSEGTYSFSVVATNAAGCSNTATATGAVISNIITVTSTADSGPGTLREAITTANSVTACGPFLITLPANQTIALTSALPDITFSGSIVGGSTLCPATGVGGSTIARDPTAGEFRLLRLNGTNKTLVVSDVSFLNGKLTAGGSVGGAILANGYALSIGQCVFRNNQAIGGGAILANRSVEIDDSFFDDNIADAGSALSIENVGQAVRIERTSFRHTTNPGFTNSSLLNLNVRTGLVRNCTFGGGGTFSSSQAIFLGAALSIPMSVTLEHNTFALRGVSLIYANASGANTSVTLQNNVFIAAFSTAVLNTFNGSNTATFTSLGGNVFASNITSNLTLLASDKNNVGTAGLSLGSLTTVTGACIPVIPLLPGSAAINAGVSSTLATDARGLARVGAPDAGAFESQGFALAISSGNNQSANVGTAFASPLRVSVSSSNGEPVDGGVVSFSTLSSGAGATLTNTTATIGSGMASVNATANATAGGPYAVTALANGTTPASVQFDLVNTMLNPAITGLAASPGTVTSGNPVTFTATVGNVSGTYTFTLTNGTSTTIGSRTSPTFSQSWTADCAGEQTFTLTVAQSGFSATATAPLTVSAHPDYAALVDFYNSTNGPGWTAREGWLQNCAPCTGNGGNPWYGLVCQGGRVVIVSLGANGLSGTIPASLSSLTNLQRLSLDNNALTGNIPASLTALNLTLLYLNNNTLSGPIPTGIGSMTNLQRLSLNSNTLTGSIPTGIGSLSALQELYLNDNSLTGSIPAGLGSLTALTQLYLRNNQLSGCYPTSLTTLCSVSLKDFQGNAGLPGLGSAASFSAFCASGAGSDAFVASATASETAVCVGNAVSLSVNGGSTATFNWLAPAGVTLGSPATTSAISATATTSGVKTFTVTVSFGTSCSTTTTVSVSVNALPTASIAPLSATLTCAQPSLTLTATSSETALRWTTGATSSTLLVTSAGAYAVTATTPAGCTVASNTVVVESNTALTGFGITASGSVCAGNPVVFTASGCTGGTVNWPGGSIGNTYSTTVAGTYTATCTIGSCSTTASGTATIGANPTPMLTASGGGTLTCAQTSLTLTATAGYVNYAFTGGQSGTGNTLAVTAAGIYSVVVTGANGCTALTSATVVSSSAVISASLVASGAISCNTPSVTLTASPSSLTYAFSGGATQLGSTNRATVSAAGTYSVTVSDAGGCTAVAQVTVMSNTTAPMGAMLTASGGGTLTCAQTALMLTASATGSLLSYSFVGAGVVAQSGSSATVNAAGAYSVVITGSNGCTTSAATTVYSNTTAPTVTLTTNQTITCASPTAILTATSGLTNYSFSTGQSGSSNLLTVTSAGTYSVIATGANGCTALTSATVVSSSAVISASLVASGAISCNTPSVTLTASPSSLTYAFSGGATQLGSTNQATVSAAGTYSVTVSDAGGCTAVAQVTVTGSTTAPTSATLTASGGGTLTCAQTALTLTASATGSLLSYSFVGAGVIAQSGSSATVNAAGAYSVVITGSNGCTTSAATTVYRNTTPPSLSITPSLVTLTCASPSAVLSVVGTGDARWSTGEVSAAISVSVANTYSVTLTGAGGCTAVANAVVSALLPASATVTAGGALGCGVTTTTVRVQASEATSFTLLGPAGYSQTNSTGVFNVSVGGSYTGVAGQSGCVVSNTVVVVEGGLQPVISSIRASGTLGSGVCSVSVQSSGSGDRYVLTGPSGYVFSVVFRTAGERTVVFPDVVKPGTYTLTVYSGNCVVRQTVAVTGTACP